MGVVQENSPAPVRGNGHKIQSKRSTSFREISINQKTIKDVPNSQELFNEDTDGRNNKQNARGICKNNHAILSGQQWQDMEILRRNKMFGYPVFPEAHFCVGSPVALGSGPVSFSGISPANSVFSSSMGPPMSLQPQSCLTKKKKKKRWFKWFNL